MKKYLIAVLFAAPLLAPATSTANERALMKFCKADAERLCPGVEPGGGRILKCLKANKEEMTVGCAQALKGLKSKLGK